MQILKAHNTILNVNCSNNPLMSARSPSIFITSKVLRSQFNERDSRTTPCARTGAVRLCIRHY